MRLAELLGFDDEAQSAHAIRQIQDHEEFLRQMEDFRGAENVLDAPIPGAHPEVPTFADAVMGVLAAAGGVPLGSMAGGMPRGLTAPGRVYHGTHSEKPLRNRPGLHVGTAEQANTRASIPNRPGGRVEMFEFTPRKTAKMEDILHQKAFIGNKLEALRPYLSAAEIERVRTSGHPRALLNRILRKKGYDAIEYANEFEGPGTSYEVLNLRQLMPPRRFLPEQDLNVGGRFNPPRTPWPDPEY
jgi:hypothetical protein